ncbi:hypothetical protein GCM10025876_15830 [Demequina litorisediminis]|uniref:beta-galactosidase n=1 Tax=Demequina litorisediminis TaxID=1849022 RepID=A0ABQ6IC28_9MICO|nr:hypothetical protein GCM10025876_15830 [Demequina litorisediminis]
MALVLAWSGRSAGPWDADPGTFEVHRLAATARTVPQSGLEAALAADDSDSPWLLSLNGTWDFTWSPSLEDAPADFWEPSVDTSDWGTVEVPHQWQARRVRQRVRWRHRLPQRGAPLAG